MIQATELRIGNLIQSETDKIVKVKSLYGDRFNIEFIDGQLHSSPLTEHQGIRLTSEILKKCGFNISQNGLFVNNNVWLEINYVGLITPVYSDRTSYKRFIGKHIKYLHQLQNLYFALTGEELEINL